MLHSLLTSFLLLLVQALATGLSVLLSASWRSSPAQASAGVQGATPAAPAAGPAAPRSDELVLERGPGEACIRFPRGETLVYRASVSLGVLSASVGTVTQTCKVEALRPSILTTAPGPTGEVASVSLHASGSYLWYTLESTLESRILPQDWPRIQNLQTSSGSERRRREVLIGRREGVPWASYRGDTDKGVPRGSPRIWRPARERAVPEGSLDMLSAVLLARTMIREQKSSLSFPLVDKTRVWRLELQRGEERLLETDAGVFEAVEIVLVPEPYPGEEFEEEKLEQFEGVFGLHGTIHLWVDGKTGIPVRIQGDIPVGVTLGIDVILKGYSGTPPDFRPVEAPR